MSNRLSKYDFFMVLMILLSIATFVGGFFLGAKLTKNKFEEEFANYFKEKIQEENQTEALSYAHTDFVSFYYQAHLPFKQFRDNYINFEQEVLHSKRTIEQLSKMIDMRQVTSSLKKELEKAAIPNTSPLLQQSQREYLLALDSYEQGFKRLFSLDKTASTPVQITLQEWEEFKAGREHWLKGQSLFYEALVAWESIYITKEKPILMENIQHYSLVDWEKLSFHQKNKLIAKLQEENHMISNYNPEDISVHLDTLVHNRHTFNQQEKILAIMQLLVASDSVRQGEFLSKEEQYASQSFPMIPLFSK